MAAGTVPSATPSLAAPAAPSPTPNLAALADFPAPETSLGQGRVLFTIIWQSRGMPAYIDKDGLHLIPSPDDFTFARAVWAGPDAILFDSERAGNRHLFRANLDGTVTQITSGDTFEGNASVSPDGTMVVYENWTADNQDLGLHIAASDGSNPRSLTPGLPVGGTGGDLGPSFSPDGQWVAFERVASFEDGQAAIFIVRIDGSDLRRLTPDALGAGYPRWSPDGTKILFSAKYPDGPAGGPLWVVSVDSGEPTPLLGTSQAEGDWAYEGDWSPDGTMIVYKYLPAGGRVGVIRMANADGTNVVDLWSAGGTGVATPDWGN